MNLKYPKVIYPILFCKYIFTASQKGGQICTQMIKVVSFLKVVQVLPLALGKVCYEAKAGGFLLESLDSASEKIDLYEFFNNIVEVIVENEH